MVLKEKALHPQQKFRFASFELDLVNNKLYRYDEAGQQTIVSIRPQAFALLVYLVKNHDKSVKRSDAWGEISKTAAQDEIGHNSGVFDHALLDLRRALKDDPNNPVYIKTTGKGELRFIHPIHFPLSELGVSDSPYLIPVFNMVRAFNEGTWEDMAQRSHELASTIYQCPEDSPVYALFKNLGASHAEITKLFAITMAGGMDAKGLGPARSEKLNFKDRKQWGGFYPEAVGMQLLVSNMNNDHATASEMEEILFGLVSNNSDRMATRSAEMLCSSARLMNKAHPTSAQRLVDRLFAVANAHTDDYVRQWTVAATNNIRIQCLMANKKYAEVLEWWRTNSGDWIGEGSLGTVVLATRAGVVRSMRELGQYKEADELSRALCVQRFGIASKEDADTLSWLKVEIAKSLSQQGNFPGAAIYLNGVIGELMKEQAPEEPTSWAYVHMIHCLIQCGEFEEALAAADECLMSFGGSKDKEVQKQCVYARSKKSKALRRLKRLEEAMDTVSELYESLKDSTDPDLVSERVWAIHSQGDIFLCQAKLRIQNGMQVDANKLLVEAERKFSLAIKESSEVPYHYGCKAYSEFLRGDAAQARTTFFKACSHSQVDWMQGEWTELEMFPIPKDEDFKERAMIWNNEARAKASVWKRLFS